MQAISDEEFERRFDEGEDITEYIDVSSANQLEAFCEGHRTWVTIGSVEARLNEEHKAGRPRKQLVEA